MIDWLEDKKFIPTVVAIVGVIVGILSLLVPSLPPVPTWYADKDKDGYGNSEIVKTAHHQPLGFVNNPDDCYDNNSNAYPGAEGYFGKHRGDGKFDFNCNGESERLLEIQGSCSNGTANRGWEGGIPVCGEESKWLLDCDRKWKITKLEIVRETENRIQYCR